MAFQPDPDWTPGTLMSSSFARLRWPVFKEISHTFVQNLVDPQRFIPFSEPEHPIAQEPASEPPLRQIRLSVHLKLFSGDQPIYMSPEALLIRRHDGGVVTVADVVEQLSAWFIAHEERIFKRCDPMRRLDSVSRENVFFDGFEYGDRFLVASAVREEDNLSY